MESALARLAELGYVDDAAFARALVGGRASRRGPRAIAAELRARGVDREATEAALAELDVAEQQRAATALARRLLQAGDGRQVQQRAATGLVRRGFDFATARAAIAAVIGERTAELG